MPDLLKTSPGNAKLGTRLTQAEVDAFGVQSDVIRSLSLPSGHVCGYAKTCRSKAVVDPITGKVRIIDGKHTKTRCFSASQEALFKATRLQRWHNWEVLRSLRSASAIADAVRRSIPANTGVMRLSVGGDIPSQTIWDGYSLAAELEPGILWYAYTKALPYWVRRLDRLAEIPNLVLTASYGGTRDDLIARHNLRSATIVYSQAEADSLGLAIDTNDRSAMDPRLRDRSFALLLHGPQPAGSEASKALSKLVKLGHKGYSRKKLRR